MFPVIVVAIELPKGYMAICITCAPFIIVYSGLRQDGELILNNKFLCFEFSESHTFKYDIFQSYWHIYSLILLSVGIRFQDLLSILRQINFVLCIESVDDLFAWMIARFSMIIKLLGNWWMNYPNFNNEPRNMIDQKCEQNKFVGRFIPFISPIESILNLKTNYFFAKYFIRLVRLF